jgi:hypothetical protein
LPSRNSFIACVENAARLLVENYAFLLKDQLKVSLRETNWNSGKIKKDN